MFEFLGFLICTIFVFIKPLSWLWHRLEDGDGWSCYLGIALTIFFSFYSKQSNHKRVFNFYHLSAVLVIFHFVIPELHYLFQNLLVLILIYSGYILCFNKNFNYHFLILIFFCLPWLSSFQFYFGYPLRLICSQASLVVFKSMYLPVELKGIMFSYQDKIIYIDAPCSGIKMLYIGMLFSVVLCILYNLSVKKTLAFFCLSFLMILVANIIRYVVLFFKEADFVSLPEWMHSGIGLILFFIFNVLCFCLVNHHKSILQNMSFYFLTCKNYLQEKGR